MRSSGVAAPPRVEASATGTVAAVVGGPRAHVYRLPGGELWFAETGEVVLAAGGAAAAVRQDAGTLIVYTGSRRTVHALPDGVAALAIADDGARVAVLVAGRPARVEWWRIGAAEPDAAVGIGDAVRGHVQGDEDLGVVVAWTGTAAAAGARPAAVLTDGGVIHRFESPPAAVTVTGGRAWAAEADGVIGRAATGDPLRLAGGLGDRIAVTPDHRHLLLYRAEHRYPAQLRLRIVSASDGTEVRALAAEVDDDLGGAFVLSPGLDVLAVHADDGGLRVRRLG
jgi:hypothetical protein